MGSFGSKFIGLSALRQAKTCEYPAGMSQAYNQRDLESFLDHGGEIRLVNDLGSGRLTGIAFRNPGAWDWQVVRVEGAEGRLFRETATHLITEQLAQAVPGVSPPSSLDGALSAAQGKLSPEIILSKLANAGAQVVAHHLGLGPIAPAIGKVAEQFVRSLPSRDNIATKVLNGARDLDVTYDLKDGHITATVRDLAADKIDNIINEHTGGITPGDLRHIQDSLQQKQKENVKPEELKEPGAISDQTGPEDETRPDGIDEPTRPDNLNEPSLTIALGNLRAEYENFREKSPGDDPDTRPDPSLPEV
jgi:hypothetical protein